MFLRSIKFLSNGSKALNIPLKSLGKVNKYSTSIKQWEEIQIPMPWGYIAGKWWGPQDKRPILCLHGWQDNCGSFDPLVQLLPDNLGYLAIDFPGHGYSSQLPKGVFYHGIDSVIFLKRIQEYFKWQKMSIIGHSMGGITGFMYNCLFPNNIDFLIAIDAIKPSSNTPGKSMNATIKTVEKFLYYDELNNGQTKPPSYTYEELVNKLHLGSRKSINIDSCKYILNRSIEKCPVEENKFFFSRDSRLKVGTLMPMQHQDILEHAKRVTCSMMVLKATKSTYYEDKKNVYDVIDILRKLPNFEYHYVDGSHHVHLNEPEKVAGLITNFILKNDKEN